MAEEDKGCVYLIYEENLALYKLGFTHGSAVERMDQINKKYRTRFYMVAFVLCINPRNFERLWHVIFGDSRVTERREWFSLTREQVEFFLAVAENMAFRYMDGCEHGFDCGYDSGYFEAALDAASKQKEEDKCSPF